MDIDFQDIKRRVDLLAYMQAATGKRGKKASSTATNFPCLFCKSSDGFQLIRKKGETPYCHCKSCGTSADVIKIEAHRHHSGDMAAAAQALSGEPEKTIRKEKSACKQDRKPTMDWGTLWDNAPPIPVGVLETWIKYRKFGQYSENASAIAQKHLRYDVYPGHGENLLAPIRNFSTGEVVGLQKLSPDGGHIGATTTDKISLGTSIGYSFFDTGSPEVVILESVANAVCVAVAGKSTACIYSTTAAQKIGPLVQKLKKEKRQPVLWLDRGAEGVQETACQNFKIPGIWWESHEIPEIRWDVVTDKYDVNNLLRDVGPVFADFVTMYLSVATQKRPAPRTIFSAQALLDEKLPDPVWTVEGLIPEGLTLLAGKPKLGKSALALNLALSVSLGWQALGKLTTTTGSVLYYALEDSKRTLKGRLTKILSLEQNKPLLINFEYSLDWQADGNLQIEEWIQRTQDAKLVIVDTLAKIRPSQGKSQSYDWDYACVSPLKTLASKHGVSILVIHHTRKAEAEDALEEVSGTLGLTGAADAVLVLRRMRGQADASLHVTGRDIEEQELALKFEFPVWNLLGKADEYKLNQRQAAIISVLKEDGGTMSLRDIHLALSEVCAGCTEPTTRKILSRMTKADQIKNDGRGKYRWIP